MLSTLVSPIDPRPIGIARIVVGVAAVIKALVLLPILLRLSEPGLIRLPGFEWMPEPSRGLAFTLVVLWCLAAVAFALGWRTALGGSVLTAAIVFALVFDAQTYSNHLYLMAWMVFLLVIGDAGTGLSVDGPSRPVVRWAALLLMLQTSIVYFFSAITKLNDDFLSGSVLAGVLDQGLVQLPETLRTPRFLMPVAVIAVMVEAFLSLALWIPRLRWLAYLLGFGLHASITLLMRDTVELLVFALLMFATYPIFAGVAVGKAEGDSVRPAAA